eukprot:4137397-Amphidinium_carterae.1
MFEQVEHQAMKQDSSSGCRWMALEECLPRQSRLSSGLRGEHVSQSTNNPGSKADAVLHRPRSSC